MSITKSSVVEMLSSLVKSDLNASDSMVAYLFDTDNIRIPRTTGPYIVSIDGNIGAGKSTLLEKMKNIYMSEEANKYFGEMAKEQIIFIQEPVDVWETFRDFDTGETILQKFYADPKKYSFAFQIMAYNTILDGFRKTIRENPDCKLIICERSLNASYGIFSQMLYDDGMIDDISFQIYIHMYGSNKDEIQLDAVLYLDVDPKTCLERVGKRSRDGEANISLEYLEKCERYYKNWLQ